MPGVAGVGCKQLRQFRAESGRMHGEDRDHLGVTARPTVILMYRLHPRHDGQAARTKAMTRCCRIGRALGPDRAGLDIRRCARKPASVGADRRGSLQASPAVSGRLVGAIGLEPTTPTMSRWCSNQLSYAPARRKL